MPSLDDISFQLGRLTAGQEAMRNEIKALFEPLAADVALMKPHVMHYRSVRKHVTWAGSLMLTVGGIFGGAIGNWVLKKYS